MDAEYGLMGERPRSARVVMEIRDVRPDDAAGICRIYNVHVRETIVTFEDQELSADAMAERIEEVQRGFPWIVCEEGGRILAYAYGTTWRSRAAYNRTAETAIYVDSSAQSRGVGTRTYQALIDRMRDAGFHQLVGGIALPNPASVALHEKLGFTRVGEFPEVGRKFDRWIDVGFWQLSL